MFQTKMTGGCSQIFGIEGGKEVNPFEFEKQLAQCEKVSTCQNSAYAGSEAMIIKEV